MKYRAQVALTGLFMGIVAGILLIPAGCQSHPMENSGEMVLTVIGALFVGLVGAVTGWLIGVVSDRSE